MKTLILKGKVNLQTTLSFGKMDNKIIIDIECVKIIGKIKGIN